MQVHSTPTRPEGPLSGLSSLASAVESSLPFSCILDTHLISLTSLSPTSLSFFFHHHSHTLTSLSLPLPLFFLLPSLPFSLTSSPSAMLPSWSYTNMSSQAISTFGRTLLDFSLDLLDDTTTYFFLDTMAGSGSFVSSTISSGRVSRLPVRVAGPLPAASASPAREAYSAWKAGFVSRLPRPAQQAPSGFVRRKPTAQLLAGCQGTTEAKPQYMRATLASARRTSQRKGKPSPVLANTTSTTTTSDAAAPRQFSWSSALTVIDEPHTTSAIACGSVPSVSAPVAACSPAVKSLEQRTASAANSVVSSASSASSLGLVADILSGSPQGPLPSLEDAVWCYDCDHPLLPARQFDDVLA